VRRLAVAAVGVVFLAALVRFALARPAVEVQFPRLAQGQGRRDLAHFREGVTVRVSSADAVRRHHPGYLVDGAPAPSLLEKWVSAPGDRAPWAEVQLRETHEVEEVALQLAAREHPAFTMRRYRIECWAGARPIAALAVERNADGNPRHPLRCPGADRVRVSFDLSGIDVARVYELEVWGQ
jgi:hypothetical protein